eukprot:1137639-Pelagomonas_calceolata.AAC.2
MPVCGDHKCCLQCLSVLITSAASKPICADHKRCLQCLSVLVRSAASNACLCWLEALPPMPVCAAMPQNHRGGHGGASPIMSSTSPAARPASPNWKWCALFRLPMIVPATPCMACAAATGNLAASLPHRKVKGKRSGGYLAAHGSKIRKDYASQVQLRALRKGPLTSKLARVSPRRFTGPA